MNASPRAFSRVPFASRNVNFDLFFEVLEAASAGFPVMGLLPVHDADLP
jgi:hypothetical protein